MNPGSGITVQTLLLSLFLSVTWGIFLVYSIVELLQVRSSKKSRLDTVIAFRRFISSVCLFMLPFSLLIRTMIVALGFGNDVAGQIVFFALVGTNLPGAVFVALTVMKPGWFD